MGSCFLFHFLSINLSCNITIYITNQMHKIIIIIIIIIITTIIKVDPEETMAWTLLNQWRDAARDPLCAIYGFATPTTSAIDAIARVMQRCRPEVPLVEVVIFD
jgi:hypothetical protein